MTPEKIKELMSITTKKGPVGLRPRKFSLLDRLDEISNALSNYLNHADKHLIPIEWVEEYNSIVKELGNDR